MKQDLWTAMGCVTILVILVAVFLGTAVLVGVWWNIFADITEVLR